MPKAMSTRVLLSAAVVLSLTAYTGHLVAQSCTNKCRQHDCVGRSYMGSNWCASYVGPFCDLSVLALHTNDLPCNGTSNTFKIYECDSSCTLLCGGGTSWQEADDCVPVRLIQDERPGSACWVSR
jgi:hypothetical protein